MSNFIQRLATASREELEAPATRAIREAIQQLHDAGIGTVGTDAHGNLVRVFPDGRSVPYKPDVESSSTPDD